MFLTCPLIRTLALYSRLVVDAVQLEGHQWTDVSDLSLSASSCTSETSKFTIVSHLSSVQGLLQGLLEKQFT